ncbi:MAG: Hpt domain-containing protein [Pirellulales bacterium]|nr:Hpt domain-containing protein [Pirellulales bacterium]
MSQNSMTPEVLYSDLATDPDLGELVEMFVDEMPDRVANIQNLLGAKDWEELRRAAHQLKGAAGSYGFVPIGPSAAALEESLRNAEPEERIRQAVAELCDLCNRVRAGAPE